MKRDYLGHAVTLALALAGSAVINAKCPPDPVPAGKPAPEAPPPPAKAEPVVPVVAPAASEAKTEGRGL
jgi:hypothetical protein